MVTQVVADDGRSSRHLLDVAGLAWPALKELLDAAELAQQQLDSPAGGSDALRGIGVATLFYEPSTRTRISFEAAATDGSIAAATGSNAISRAWAIR